MKKNGLWYVMGLFLLFLWVPFQQGCSCGENVGQENVSEAVEGSEKEGIEVIEGGVEEGMREVERATEGFEGGGEREEGESIGEEKRDEGGRFERSFRVFSSEVDLVPPKLEGMSFSPNPVKAGEVLSVKVETGADLSGVIAAQVTLQSTTGKHSLYVSTTYHPQQQVFLGQVRIPRYVEGGVWRVVRVSLQDLAGNPAIYLGSQPPLDGLSFQVENTASDVEAPLLRSVGIESSDGSGGSGNGQLSVKADEYVVVFLDIGADVSGVTSVQIQALGEQGGFSSAQAYYHPQKKRYEARLWIPKTGQDGVWKLTQVSLRDGAENQRVYTEQDVELGQQRFQVVGSVKDEGNGGVGGVQDQEAPEVTGLWMEPSQLRAGEAIRLWVKGKDGISGVARVQAAFSDPTGAERIFMDLAYQSGNQLWEGQSAVPLYSRDGMWALQRITITDRAGNSKSYAGEDLEGMALLSSEQRGQLGRFAATGVAGANADREAPEVLGLRFAPSTAKQGEEVRLYAALRDQGGSGIASASCTVQSPEPEKQKRALLVYNSDTGFYEGNLRFDSGDPSGDWWLSGCYITDRAGHATSVSGGHIAKLALLDISRATSKGSQEPYQVKVLNEGGGGGTPSSDKIAPRLVGYHLAPSVIRAEDEQGRFFAKIEEEGGSLPLDARCVFQAGETREGGGYSLTRIEVKVEYKEGSGFWEGEILPGRQAQGGWWWLQGCTLRDRVGNERRYEGIELAELPAITVEGMQNSTGEHRGFQVVAVAAPSDQKKPVIEGGAIAPSSIQAGSAGRVFLKAFDDREIVSAFCAIKPPIEERPQSPYLSAVLQWNPQNQLWEGNFRIPSNSLGGIWSLSRCQVMDSAGNQSEVRDDQWESLKDLDISKFFPVQMTSRGRIDVEIGSSVTPPTLRDQVPPTLLSVQWKPQATRKAGEAVVLEVRAEDAESGVGQIAAQLQSPTQKVSTWLSFSYDSGRRLWYARFVIPRYGEDGAWKLKQLTVTDRAGNQSIYDESASEIAFLVLQVTESLVSPDQTAPNLVSLQRSQGILLQGEASRFVAELQDESPIEQSWLQIRSPQSQQLQVPLSWNPATLRYEGEASFSSFAALGDWQISIFYAKDIYGNILQIPQGDTRFQSLSISVRSNPLTEDKIAPVLEGLMLGEAKAQQGKEIRVFAKIKEEGSGLLGSLVILRHTPSGQQISTSLTENPASGLWEGNLSFPPNAALGTWSFFRVSLEDRAGNSSVYTEDHPLLKP